MNSNYWSHDYWSTYWSHRYWPITIFVSVWRLIKRFEVTIDRALPFEVER